MKAALEECLSLIMILGRPGGSLKQKKNSGGPWKNIFSKDKKKIDKISSPSQLSQVLLVVYLGSWSSCLAVFFNVQWIFLKRL